MKRVLPILLMLLCAAARGESVPAWWQLVFEYDAQSLRLVEAAEIAPMQKTPQTPGLDGAPGVIRYQATWLDSAERTIHSGEIALPIGWRSAPEPEGACVPYMPAADTIVVRCQGPAFGTAPAKLSLQRVGADRMATVTALVPSALAFANTTLACERVVPLGTTVRTPGPISATKIRDTGPDSNRLTIVIVGDGYTAANLAANAFTNASANLVTALGGRSPWDVYLAGTNVYRIDTESNEQGADYEDAQFGTLKDTYYNSAFWTSAIERLLAIDSTGRNRAISAANSLVGAGAWDYIFVVVNSTKYGGSGGSIAVSSVHPSSPDVVIHEFGHTFAQLADEYTTAYPGYPPGDGEPNVDYDASGPGLKWLAWVESGTPLPTPDTSPYSSTVGTFEGARYLTTGIYRPWRNCLMRSLGVNFCPVCKQAHVLRYHAFTQMADSRTPAAGPVYDLGGASMAFSVTPLPLAGLAFAWDIDGTPIPGQTAASINLTPAMIGVVGTTRTLRITVSDPTPLNRATAPSDSYTWSVRTSAIPSSVGEGWESY